MLRLKLFVIVAVFVMLIPSASLAYFDSDIFDNLNKTNSKISSFWNKEINNIQIPSSNYQSNSNDQIPNDDGETKNLENTETENTNNEPATPEVPAEPTPEAEPLQGVQPQTEPQTESQSDQFVEPVNAVTAEKVGEKEESENSTEEVEKIPE